MSLAFPVGAILVVFTIVNALWLSPVPFPEPDRLVMLIGESESGSVDGALFTGLEVFREAWNTFESVAGQVATSGSLGSLRPRIVLENVGRELETLGVTSDYFRVLGVPVRGRDFTRADNRRGAEPVAIMSDRLWSREFGRQPGVVGSIVGARPIPIRIVGVAPPGFVGARRGERTDLWIPSSLVPRVAPAGEWPEDSIPSLVIARLRPGQTPAQASRGLVQNALDGRDRLAKESVRIVPLARVFGTPGTPTTVTAQGRAGGIVAGLAALVLAGGCTTLAILVLVHYERRRLELAVRLALGASRGRLILQLAGELTWIVGAAMASALLVAVLGLRALPSLSVLGRVDLRRLDLTMDRRVIAFCLATTVLTLAVAALVPVVRFTRSRLAGELLGPALTWTPSSQRVRQVLLGTHVAATMIVLIGAGLFIRAVVHGFNAGAGFDVDKTLFVQVQLTAPSFAKPDPNVGQALLSSRRVRLEEGLRSLPGVELIARGRSPIGPEAARWLLRPRSFEADGHRREMLTGVASGDPELLAALGVPLLRGRPLTAADAVTYPQPVILTSSLARALWPRANPLGQPVHQWVRGSKATSIVVGIAADFACGTMTAPSVGVVVVAARPLTDGGEQSFVIRAERPDLITPSIRGLVATVIPDAPRSTITTGRQIVAEDLGRQRLGAWFFSGFGLIALVLGAGSVFGLVAYLAESRRREFGVRAALGAAPRDLLWRGVIAGIAPMSIGAAAGLVAAALISRVLLSLLPGLSTLDPVTYVGAVLLVITTGTAAAVVPAWRLRDVTPAEALRAE